VYDEVDNVYIFGGLDYTKGRLFLNSNCITCLTIIVMMWFRTARSYTGDILRYSISLDKVEKVSCLCGNTYGGVPLKAKDGRASYRIGGEYYQRTVQKSYFLTYSTVLLPTDFPSDVQFSGGVSMSGTIFLFDGREKEVME
jgi:hypothetical protein